MVTGRYTKLENFKFWCMKVLPLVYDDSLSYYEVLCKVVKYLNDIIENDKVLAEGLGELKAELDEVQTWINNFDTSYAEQIIKDSIATMIFVGITDAGYIVYYIPENWHDIVFNTTGLDVVIEGVDEYGRLVLSY